MSVNDNTWQQPIPLFHMGSSQSEYPIHALPDIIKNAILSYSDYGQQPIAMLANSALSNVSLACQGISNVARDRVLVSPIGMYFITVAASGERKSGCDRVFGTGIDEWEKETIEKLLPEHNRQKNEYTTWAIKRNAILATIKRLATQDYDTDQQEDNYDQIMMEEPEVCLLPKLKYEDITVEALTENLGKGWSSGAIWSDEAGIFLSSPGMKSDNTKFVALLNRLWDAQPISVYRKTTGNTFIKDRRFTLNLMMQPILLHAMLNKQDGINRHSGFLARTLISYPTSNIGERYYKEPVNTVTKALEAFHNRIKECLDETLPVDKHGFKDIPTLTFSAESKKVWVKYFDYIESAMANEFQWQSIHDIASKAGENIARLSALFHVFTGSSGTEISADHIHSAYKVIEWHLNEAKRIFGETDVNQVEHDAKLVLNFAIERNIIEISARDLLRNSPLGNESLITSRLFSSAWRQARVVPLWQNFLKYDAAIPVFF